MKVAVLEARTRVVEREVGYVGKVVCDAKKLWRRCPIFGEVMLIEVEG